MRLRRRSFEEQASTGRITSAVSGKARTRTSHRRTEKDLPNDPGRGARLLLLLRTYRPGTHTRRTGRTDVPGNRVRVLPTRRDAASVRSRGIPLQQQGPNNRTSPRSPVVAVVSLAAPKLLRDTEHCRPRAELAGLDRRGKCSLRRDRRKSSGHQGRYLQ